MQIDDQSLRRARTRSLIQLGGLIEKSGLMDHFGLALGSDMQKDLETKYPVAAFMGALLELKQHLIQSEIPFSLLAEQGMKFLSTNDNTQNNDERKTDNEQSL